MIELSRLTVLILAELLLGLGLITLVLISMAVIRRQKAHKAARQLVERIRHDEQPRSERLRQKLSDVYRYQGETLEQTLDDLNRVEKQLFQKIINGFLKRDLSAFQQLDVDVDNLVLAYQGLEPALEQAVSASADTPFEAADREEIERLQADNQRLSDELKITMDTMARMISEYAAMFASEMGGQGDEEASLPADSSADYKIGQQSEGYSRGGSPPAVQPDVSLVETPGASETDGTPAEKGGLQEALAGTGKADDQAVDEVLEVADDFSELVVNAMSQMDESDPESVPQESLPDEFEQVEIESPKPDKAVAGEATESVSLEQEWAKLLAEEAHPAEPDAPADPPRQG
jgi:hypothetical protein